MPERRGWGSLLALAGLALLAAGLGYALYRAQRLPEGPQPIVWDREACAFCHMHIGEPRFAAQLQTEEGRVLDFDDPGCLLSYELAERPRARARYFHALREDRWLSADEVAFVPAEGSPMGFDLGAVPRGTPGALSYEEAQRRVQAAGRREGGRGR